MTHHQFHDDCDRPNPQTPIKGTHEVPVSAPIFEGHLYLQHPEKSNRWQWRLFRFDGAAFTCLSTRKIKLPPDTIVDTPNENIVIQSLSTQQIFLSASFHTSHTSPLLATPKDKTQRLVSIAGSSSMPNLLQHHQYDPPSSPVQQQQQEPFLASYYQLPKWTVEIANISAISILKSPKKRSPFGSSSSKSKCFCVRTYDGNCYVMKAQKYKDLERWLFVLTKMWKFAQTIRNQMIGQQQQQQSVVVMQQQAQYSQQQSALYRPPLPPQLSWEQQQQQSQPQPQPQPQLAYVRPADGKTVRSLVPPMPPLHDVGPSKGAGALPAHLQHRATMMSPPQPRTSASASAAVAYDTRYRAPMLSMEKTHWIDQWRESLAELAVYERTSTSPPPIEPIPDDDQISSISGFTSISHRERTSSGANASNTSAAGPRQGTFSPRRKTSKRSLRSIAASMKRSGNETIKLNSIAPVNAFMPQELPLEDRPSSSLKKKRSDEVKNWISSNNNNRTEEYLIAVAPDINFFQDVKTILDGGESSTPDGGGTAGTNNNNNNADYQSSVRYHSSIRGRNIQVVDEEDEDQDQDQEETGFQERQPTPADPSISKKAMYRASLIADGQIHGTSPLQTLAKADGAHALQQIHYSKHNSSPSLLRHAASDDDNDDEENMSLADVQRNLRRVSVNSGWHEQQQKQRQTNNRIRSPSASSILDRCGPFDASSSITSNRQSGMVYHPNPAFYSSSTTAPVPVLSPAIGPIPSIVAPAIPPVPVAVGNGRSPGLLDQHPHRGGNSSGLYIQPTLSSSEITSTHSKKMYQFFETQSSSRTAATTADRGIASDKKQRPQSWMISPSKTMSHPAPQNTKTALPPSDYYHTRRSIDISDTRRMNNTTHGWN